MSPGRAEDIDRLYRLLSDLERRLGGTRTLDTATGGQAWPSHGVYFCFEPRETRSNGRPRVVRVGTHALTTTSRTTLWQRLSQHRGNLRGSNPGGGNHRASIFRLHVGAALLRRDHAPEALLESWLSKKPQPQWAAAEAEHERNVSRHIGAMPFVWLPVPTKPDGTSERGYLERNSIALLSGAEPASPDWLGHHAVNPAIRRSGLWNANHVHEQYRLENLDRLEEYLLALPTTRQTAHGEAR
jgi:hypothetical protein